MNPQDRNFTAAVERDRDTGLLVGWIPGIAGVYAQADTLDELYENLREVLIMLAEDGPPAGHFNNEWAIESEMSLEVLPPR